MPDLSQLDPNFITRSLDGETDLVFHSVREDPFEIHGLIAAPDRFRRLPEDLVADANLVTGIGELCKHTAGGRVCFRTDSDTIAVYAVMPGMYLMPHMAFLGSGGFDLYERKDGRQTYTGSFIPDKNNHESVRAAVTFGEHRERELILEFPLYSGVCEVYVGLKKNASLTRFSGYTRKVPMVFYGSSITQGGCASAPGTSYEAILSRRFDADYLNMGFSGNAKGEKKIMDYIASLPMSLFFYDYDYNAPSVEHLEKTHYAGYRTVRDAHPDIPIFLCGRPNFGNPENDAPARRAVIKSTYDRARAEGDKHIYFIDNAEVFRTFYEDGCTVDGCHPNDHGFFRMADVFAEAIASASEE